MYSRKVAFEHPAFGKASCDWIGRVAKHHIYLGEINPVLWPMANAASLGAYLKGRPDTEQLVSGASTNDIDVKRQKRSVPSTRGRCAQLSPSQSPAGEPRCATTSTSGL
jgi:hypothetical protein